MFRDREEAGRKLAQNLKQELSPEDLRNSLVLAIPRGGVAIGKEISLHLELPFDVLIIKKIPAPNNEELAIGAVGEGGVVVWEQDLCERLAICLDYKQEIVKTKVIELEKKEKDFRGDKPIPEINGKIVVIADDGIATGATIKAAIKVVRSFNPEEVIVAVPVIASDSLEEVKKIADRVIYLEAPEMFFAVGQFYQNFSQVTDEEVRKILSN